MVALKLHRAVVAVELGLTVAELAIPLAALTCLQTILVTDLHQHPILGKLLQNSPHIRTKLAVISGQIFDQKVGQVLLLGANADIRATFTLKFAN